MKCTRRTVVANLEPLENMDVEIDREKGVYLISREFEEYELRMLVDSVLFFRSLSGTAAKELIDKLEGFGNKYFKAKVSHVASAPNLVRIDNMEVFPNIEEINDAIDAKKKIKFRYYHYVEDFKLHDRGRDYVMSPYQMVASNGHYYLLGSLEGKDTISHYRIDKIKNVETLDERVKTIKEIPGLEHGLDLPKHMAEHVYMFRGKSIPVRLKTTLTMLDDLIDWFGKNIKILNKDGDDIHSTSYV